MTKSLRLAYLVSHPIQYQAPLLRRIAEESDLDLTVFFGSDFSVRGYKDEGFGVGVQWDVPLLEGYRYEVLPALRDNGTASVMSPLSRGVLDQLRGTNKAAGFDALWVHGYSTANAVQGMVAAKALGIPVLLRAESWLRDRPRSGAKLAAKMAFFRGLRQMIDAVLPIGTLNAEYWRYYLGEQTPQFLMPYAVDNSYFRSRSEQARGGREALQAELRLDPARPVILFASKLQTRKCCEDLVEAFRLLSARRMSEGRSLPYLLIVGDGEERRTLEARAAGLEQVRFCGFRNQSELPRFFDLATVFVLPSRHEPWGLIVNEVMNAGKPVILSDDVGCQPDLITDGVEGCIFPVGDTVALADALRRVLADETTAAAMGQRARARISSWSFEEDVRGLRTALAQVTRRIQA